MTFDPAQLDSITGFLLPDEADLLYRLAADVPKCGTIVEIGSYQGKSTVALALGVKTKDYIDATLIYAIDPHIGETRGGLHFGIHDQVALFKNLLRFDVADVVNVISMPSSAVANSWCYGHVDLLWIDGDHHFPGIANDILLWSRVVSKTGKIVLHDYANPDFPGVREAVNEFVASSNWHITQQVDTIVVLEQIKG